MIRHASLFSGIGGFDLAAKRMNWQNVFQCEIDDYCRKLLNQHFPNTTQYADICQTDFKPYRNTIDVLSGGFPCQPFSVAGKQQGTNDHRFLWDEMLRAIQEISPQCIVGENVFNLIQLENGKIFESICTDLESQGYTVTTFVLPACSVGAYHERKRIFLIANAHSIGLQKSTSRFGQSLSICNTSNKTKRINQLPPVKRVFPYRNLGDLRKGDGVSRWMDRIKGLGNAVVPQLAFQVFSIIEQTFFLTNRQN